VALVAPVVGSSSRSTTEEDDRLRLLMGTDMDGGRGIYR
jgi:hypothetical protein